MNTIKSKDATGFFFLQSVPRWGEVDSADADVRFTYLNVIFIKNTIGLDFRGPMDISRSTVKVATYLT